MSKSQLSKDALFALAENVAGLVLRQLKEGGGLIAPFLFVGKGKSSDVIELDFTNREEKDFKMFELNRWLKKFKPDVTVFVSEAWMSIQTVDTLIDNLEILPSEHPDRKEIVLIDAACNYAHLMGIAEFTRHEDGLVKDIAPFKWFSTSPIESKLTDGVFVRPIDDKDIN